MKNTNTMEILINELKLQEPEILKVLIDEDELQNLDDKLDFSKDVSIKNILDLDIYVVIDEDKEEIAEIGFNEEGLLIKVESLRDISSLYSDLTY